MAQGFVIGMAALGAAVLVLQKERATIAASQVARTDPSKVASGGVTVAQGTVPPPIDSGAFGAGSMAASSDDGTTAGNTSCSPSTPPVNLPGVGAVPTATMEPALVDSAESFQPPSTSNGDSSTAPSDGTVRGQAAAETPPTIPMPSTTYRSYILGITYGLGQTVTSREESENLSTVGPSVGAIW